MKVQGVSRQILAETPARVVAFLRGVRTHEPVRRLLSGAGYSQAHHDEGVRLLGEALRFLGVIDGGGEERVGPAEKHAAVEEALAECEAFVRVDLRRARAALTHRHPEEETFVFASIDATDVGSAAFVTQLFLSRLDEMERDGSAPRRTALATLEERGFTREKRAHWQERTNVALGKDQHFVPPAVLAADEPAMHALRAWYAEWAETAHAVVTTRDGLIRLGLAHRKHADEASDEPAD